MRPASTPLWTIAPVCATLALGCSDSTSPKKRPTLPTSLALSPMVTLSGHPLYGTAPANDSRLFLVEREGRIVILRNNTLADTVFLDISGEVSTAGEEQGLLSMAFDPNYASNGYFYVYYTDVNGNIQISRYTRSASSPNVADPTTAKSILSIAHPSYNDENGGLVVFGPDGKLYIGTGYGGSPDDQDGNAQNKNSLLGKILRIDVSGNGADPYAIPSDNPFVGQSGARGEVWGYGLRNPWRFTFDPQTTLLYIADVGDEREEEIDVIPSSQSGDNFGWPVMEGSVCHSGSSCTPPAGSILPLIQYAHNPSDQCNAIIGGFVYRGTQIPGLAGQYFYSDFCAGGLASFQAVNGVATNQRTWQVGSTGFVEGFGRDATGELYLLEDDGTVAKIVQGTAQ